MKHIVFLLFGVLPLFSLGNSTFSEGSEAFKAKNYALSADKFDSVISISPNNIAAYYNYSLAKMKTRNYGEAIWGFEKVLKFRPSDAEAKEKIQECYLELNSNHFGEYRLNGFKSSLYSVSANSWGVFVILFAILLGVSVVVFRMKQSHSTRRLMLLLGIVSSFLLMLTILTGALSKKHATSNNLAIITSKNLKSLHKKVSLYEGDFVQVTSVGDTEVKLQINGEMLSVKLEDLKFI